MIFLHQARLLILSQPKTGTTALEAALAARASIAVNGPPELKHIAYGEFMTTLAPWIEAATGFARRDYEVITVMRDPLDWVGSWYRYRTRKRLSDPQNPRAQNYTGDMRFEDFVAAVCTPEREQPAFARIRTPSWVARDRSGHIGADRIFPYEDLSGLYAFIEERTGKPVETRPMNVSPAMPLSLSEETEAVFRTTFADDFALHASLARDGTVDNRFRERPAPSQ